MRDDVDNDSGSGADRSNGLKAKPSTPKEARQSPVVPSTGLAGRALTFVVAAMCFLACLFFATMMSAQRTADHWSSRISSEITIQVLPDASLDLEAQVAEVVRIAAATTGVTSVRNASDADLSSLLEPWLGDSIEVDDLPVPRLVFIRIDPVDPPDLDALAVAVGNAVPNAILDDHRFWHDRLKTGARSIAIIGGLLFALVLAVMIASVVFATRGTMSGNREVIEVLHFVGAPEHFIAAEFQRHFLVLGLRAGVIGGAAAIAVLAVLSGLLTQWIQAQQADELRILIGDFGIDVVTLVGIAVIVGLVAALTALTTRATVFRHLRTMQ